jgi:tryptophanyl-tRNA synthetase
MEDMDKEEDGRRNAVSPPKKFTVSEVEGPVDYEGLMKEFGIDSMLPLLPKLPEPDAIYRRGVVFAHRDMHKILHAAANKKPFAVLTGFNPSGPLHLGNLMFVKQALYFQKLGAEVFIPISNDETYVFRKTDDIDKATRTALEVVIPDLIALGFEQKKTRMFISTKEPRAYELAVKLSTKATFSTMKAIFGFNDQSPPGQIFYGVMQASHILFPQLADFGGPKPTVVPIGIDQDPYMRLARDIADKEAIGMEKPASTYHRFIPSIKGPDVKMSGSKPETAIFLTDTPEAARKKIMGAFSGGGATLKEHKEKGGNPDIDVACQYLYFLFEESDKKVKEIFEGFRNGSLTSGDVKGLLADKVAAFLKDHQAAAKKAQAKVPRFLTHEV